MDLRKLSFFVTLAEVGSFTNAAAVLRISQPSLSHAIQKLEEEVDVILFERTKKGVYLTDDGDQFYQSSKEFLQHYKTLKDELYTIKTSGTGTISIGMIEAVKNWVPQIITKHQLNYPDQNFELYEILSPEDIISSLKSYRTHVCISNYLASEDFIHSETLYEEEFMLIAKPGSFPSLAKEISIADLEGLPLILSPNKYLTHHTILQAFYKAGVRPRVHMEVERFETACTCVEEGLGITFLPKKFIQYSRLDHLQIIRPIHPTPVRSVYLLYNQHRVLNQSVVDFVKLCRRFK